MKAYEEIDYSQYEKNKKLSFALASMMFEPYTHIIVSRRVPGKGLQVVGGGHAHTVLKRFGDFEIAESRITWDGVLRIIVE